MCASVIKNLPVAYWNIIIDIIHTLDFYGLTEKESWELVNENYKKMLDK